MSYLVWAHAPAASINRITVGIVLVLERIIFSVLLS
jgi:hypothetical protein